MEQRDAEPLAAHQEAPEPTRLSALRAKAGEAQAQYAQAVSLAGGQPKPLVSAAQRYTTALLRYCVALEAELDRARAARGSPLPRGADTGEVVADIAPTVRALKSWDTRARLAARQKLQEMGPAAVGPLLALIRREAAGRERRGLIVAGLALLGIAAGFVGIALASNPNWSGGPAYVLAIPTLLGSLAFTRASSLQRAAAQILAQYEDVRVIGPLIDSLSIEDQVVQHAAAEALTRLLPRVKASDGHYLSASDMDSLLRALDSGDPDLVVSVLRALEQVGDERFLPKVERLAGSQPYTRAEYRVRDAAKECIPALLARTEPGRGERVLLRAASAPDNQVDTLLRPAQEAGSQSPEVLLRPSIPEQHD